MNSYFHGIWRMDWGLGNPNKTAALIATLMVAVWVLAYVRKWGFWAALVLFSGLGICLIHTFSRGGVVALFAGLIPLVICSPRPWAKSRVLAAMMAIWVIIVVSVCWKATDRYSQGIQEDRSITARLALWKAAPQMMRDAPSGWGLGNSGKAYMQWYQPLDHSEEYRTLVNSHLTWLVEGSWLLRFLYILAWLAVLALCWPSKAHRGLAIPFGVWISFAVAAWFSSVAESFWIWIVPCVSLVAVLFWRIRRKVWPRPLVGLILIGVAGMMTMGLFVLGRSNTNVHGSRDQIVFGTGKPRVWLVVDDKTLGNNYGSTLRKFLQSGEAKKEAVVLVNSVALLGDVSDQTVILSGPVSSKEKDKLKTIFASAKRVVLLNPTFFPQEISFSRGNAAKTEVVFGEFSQSPAIQSWTELVAVRRIEGVGDFLPCWPEIVLARP